nr:MAG: putative capsid protein [Arizlama virus]
MLTTRKRKVYGARTPIKRRTFGGKKRYYKRMTVAPRFNRPEMKSLDVLYTMGATLVGEGSVVGSGAANSFITGMSAMNLVQQGATFYQRIGTKINIRSIELEGKVEQGSNVDYMAYCRYLIVYDRQANGAYPTLQNILQDNDGNLTFNSGVNLQNRSRFSIIRDKRFLIDAASGLQTMIKDYCKGNWESEYGTNTGLIGDIRTGALYVIAFAYNAGAGGGDAPVPLAFKSRVRYIDN